MNNKQAWDTKDFVVCETNLGKLRSELKAAQTKIDKLEAALESIAAPGLMITTLMKMDKAKLLEICVNDTKIAREALGDENGK